MALTDKLTSIANAIREKGGTTEKLTLDAMPTAIAALSTGGGDDKVPNPIEYTGDLYYLFEHGRNTFLLQYYIDRIKIDSPTQLGYAFNWVKEAEKAPSITNSKNVVCSWDSCFKYGNFKEIGDIDNFNASKAADLFSSCQYLKHCPNFTGTFACAPTNTYSGFGSWFKDCYSIRTISPVVLANITNTSTSSTYVPYCYMFKQCFALDEIVGLNVIQTAYTTNVFSETFTACSRLKRLTFKTKEDGTPYTANWKGQTISLYDAVGWLSYPDSYITGYNSGITKDKKITMIDGNYHALKNDPDCYTGDPIYSRFNHDSAVEFINSLPDTSKYLADMGGTNTVKFRNNAGSNTDGGGIGSLTEEEIAVAVAKGWSITYGV